MRPLRNILSAETTLANLLDRRARELALLHLLRTTLPPALAVMQKGLASRPHAAFVKRLAAAHKHRTP